MKIRTVCLYFISMVVSCAGCSCGDTQSSSTKVKEMNLRIVSSGQFISLPPIIELMIVGVIGKPMDVYKLSVSDIKAEDQTGRCLPISLEREPGDSSKFGPFVSILFDAKDAQGTIVITGKIAYKDEVYILEANYSPGSSNDDFLWKEDRCLLKLQN